MFVLKWRTLAQGFRQLTCTSGISLQVSVHINGHNHGIGWVSYSAQMAREPTITNSLCPLNSLALCKSACN